MLILMLVMVQLSLVSYAALCVFNNAILNRRLLTGSRYYCMRSVIPTSAPLFLGLAILLNLNKWTYFNLVVMEVNLVRENQY